MERPDHQLARRRPAPLQRDQAHGGRHLAAHAHPDAARARAGRIGDADFPTIPPRVDYELTDLGRSLWKPVEALGTWAREHLPEIEAAKARFDKRAQSG